jgi:hypothetical protein
MDCPFGVSLIRLVIWSARGDRGALPALGATLDQPFWKQVLRVVQSEDALWGRRRSSVLLRDTYGLPSLHATYLRLSETGLGCR